MRTLSVTLLALAACVYPLSATASTSTAFPWNLPKTLHEKLQDIAAVPAHSFRYFTWSTRASAPKWRNMGGNFHNRPEVVTANEGHMEVHCSHTNNSMWQKVWTVGKWGEWEYTDPIYFSYRHPAVVAHHNGDLDRFSVWRYYWLVTQSQKAGEWGEWYDLKFVVSEVPLGLALPNNDLAIFARGSDNAVWQLNRRGGVFKDWYGLGGSFQSRPTGGSLPDGEMLLLARDLQGVVMYMTIRDGHRTGWRSTGVHSTCDAQVASNTDGLVIAYCLRSGSIGVSTYTRGFLSKTVSIGGNPSDVPAIALTDAGDVYVVIRDTRNRLAVSRKFRGRWGSWKHLSGIKKCSSAPSALSRGSGCDVFVLGADTTLRHATI